jgi:hypothetical protein
MNFEAVTPDIAYMMAQISERTYKFQTRKIKTTIKPNK